MPRKAETEPMLLTWNIIASFACTLPDTNFWSYNGRGAVQVNGRAMLEECREHDSFILHIDKSSQELWLRTNPETFWQMPEHNGSQSLLVRFNTPQRQRVFDAIKASWVWAGRTNRINSLS